MNGQYFWLTYSQKDSWKELFSKIPPEKRDIYYNPEYVRLYAECDSQANCYIYNNGNDIYIYPFIMRSVPKINGYFDISTPYGYGGPIANTQDPIFLNEAYQVFYQEAIKRNVIAELIKFHPLLFNHQAIETFFKGNITRMCSTVYVDLDIDEDYRWKSIYTHANRKNINKAKRNNITVKIDKNEDSWKAFEDLYEITMTINKAKEFYFFSQEYFKNIQNKLKNDYILISCLVEGKIVSSMLALLGTESTYCHLIGTNRDFVTTGVNNLLHHELILWSKNKGYKNLYIGGGRTNDDNDFLLRFKKSFSNKIVSLYVGETVLNPAIYNELCSQKDLDSNISQCLLKYRP